MADMVLSVVLTRTSLGLDPLEISSGDTYYLAPQFLGSNPVTWTRQQVSSPFADGQVTTQRARQNVMESIGVEVRAITQYSLKNAITELVQAFLQDAYTLHVHVGLTNAHYAYRCETADYQFAMWTTPRVVGVQAQILFTVPRQPVGITTGGI